CRIYYSGKMSLSTPKRTPAGPISSATSSEPIPAERFSSDCFSGDSASGGRRGDRRTTDNETTDQRRKAVHNCEAQRLRRDRSVEQVLLSQLAEGVFVRFPGGHDR